VSTLPPADPHHDAFGRERHARDDDSFDGDDAVKCSGGAHVVPLGFGCLIATETTSTTCAPFNEVRALRGAAVNPSGDWPFEATTSRQGRQVTHTNPRSP